MDKQDSVVDMSSNHKGYYGAAKVANCTEIVMSLLLNYKKNDNSREVAMLGCCSKTKQESCDIFKTRIKSSWSLSKIIESKKRNPLKPTTSN